MVVYSERIIYVLPNALLTGGPQSMRHMSLFVFSSLFALSLVMALPSKVNGESHSLDLDPLYKMFANGVQVDVHKTSHAFKRCAALLYGLYQLSSNQSDHFRDILLT
jgi:hypothetical protein